MERVAPLRALIVEDEPAVVDALELHLAWRGFRVVGIVDSFAQAVVRAQVTHPHVIVVDVTLGGPLGVRVVPVLASAAPHSVIVVLSPFLDVAGDALEAGASVVLEPSDLRPFAGLLERVRATPGVACTCELS